MPTSVACSWTVPRPWPPRAPHLTASGVADRAECVAGDFFVSVPVDGDAYALSVSSTTGMTPMRRGILATCRNAMRRDSRLLVVDAILPERAVDRPGVIRMDLHMLLLFGARERTEAELRALLATAGFGVQGVMMTPSPAGLGIVEAIPR